MMENRHSTSSSGLVSDRRIIYKTLDKGIWSTTNIISKAQSGCHYQGLNLSGRLEPFCEGTQRLSLLGFAEHPLTQMLVLNVWCEWGREPRTRSQVRVRGSWDAWSPVPLWHCGLGKNSHEKEMTRKQVFFCLGSGQKSKFPEAI